MNNSNPITLNKADMTIQCDDNPEYNFIRVYASLMLLVYPLGVPFYYLWTLWPKRKAIISMDRIADPCDTCGGRDGNQKALDEEAEMVEEMDEEEKKAHFKKESKDDLYAVAFLFQSYKGRFWYWEVVETTRRLMLTAVLSIIESGTSSQIVCAMLLAVFYVRVYSKFQPYKDEMNEILAELGQYQIFFTFFGSLIIKEEVRL